MSTLGGFIWSIADQLRGPYRPNQYGNVILPLLLLTRTGAPDEVVAVVGGTLIVVGFCLSLILDVRHKE